MSWENVNLADVDLTPKPLDAGEYTFRLRGAKLNDRDPNQIDVQFAVVEGDFAGRTVFAQYPDPDRFDWSPKAMKRLEIALGVDALENEHPVTYLNRIVGNGVTRITATVKQREYKDKTTGEPRTAVDFQLFSVRPAA